MKEEELSGNAQEPGSAQRQRDLFNDVEEQKVSVIQQSNNSNSNAAKERFNFEADPLKNPEAPKQLNSHVNQIIQNIDQ